MHSYARLCIASDAFLTIRGDGTFLANVNRSMECEIGFKSLSSFPNILYIRASLNIHGDPGIWANDSTANFYTDESWDCRRFPNGTWSKAKSYAVNDGKNSSWKIAISKIAPRAHWIWTNASDTEVECRKVFSGEK